MIVQAIRSALFYALFLGQTVVLAFFVGLWALTVPRGQKAPDAMWAIGRYWGHANLFFLRWVVGIRTEVLGFENIPQGGCILASKHQSDWDILALIPYLPLPAFIAKRQLMDIPFFGWAARAMNTISVDRKLGAGAIPAMLADAHEKLAAGSQVIIFPEGTRKAPLAQPDYRHGIVRMYAELGVPVVPVAVNSGFYWGRNSLVLWPGTARARILPPIPPGLPPEEFRELLIGTIESATAELARRADRDGLTRPVSPELRQKLDGLTAASVQTTTY